MADTLWSPHGKHADPYGPEHASPPAEPRVCETCGKPPPVPPHDLTYQTYGDIPVDVCVFCEERLAAMVRALLNGLRARNGLTPKTYPRSKPT